MRTKPGKEILEKIRRTAYEQAKTYDRYIRELSNPDPVLNTTSEGIRKGLDLFDEIRRDPQVIADLKYRQLKVRSFSWNIAVNTKDDRDIDQANSLAADIEKGYHSLVLEIQDAMVKGFSVTELMWVADPVSGRIVLTKASGLEQKQVSFPYAYSEGDEILYRVEYGQTEPLPRERIALATFWEEKGNVCGNALVSYLFWPWWFKKHAWLFYSNYIERFAQPTPKGTFPPGTPKDTQEEMLASLEAIQSDFAVVFPESWNVELLEATRSGNLSSYKDFIRMCDMYISKVILMSTLTSNEAEYGTRAQAEVHADLTDEAIQDDARWIEDVVTGEVIARLAEWNYNFSPEAQPHLVIQYQSEDTSKEAAERDEAVQRLVPCCVSEIYEKYGKKQPEDDDIVTYNGELWRYGDLKEKILDKKKKPAVEPPAGPVSVEAEAGTDDTEEEEKDGEFAESEPGIDDLVEQEGEYIENLYAANRERMRENLDLKSLRKILEKAGDYNEALEKIEKYRSKKSEPFWAEMLTLSRLLGEYVVLRQVEYKPAGGEFDEGGPVLLEADADAYRVLVPKNAIRWLRNRIAVTSAVWKQLEADARMAAFYVAGLENEDLIAFVKEQMIEALAAGKPYRQFLKEMFELTGAVPFFSSMKTSFNTNMFSALSVQNEIALLRNTDRFPYWRYSAILDGKQRPAHGAMHNFVARYDDPVWLTWTPPNGFNCRCRKVICPAATYEKYRPLSEQKQIPEVDPNFDHNPLMQNFKALRELLQERKDYSGKLSGRVRSEIRQYLKALQKGRGRGENE